MAKYIFGSQRNSYFLGQDMRVTRESDGRTILVNGKSEWGDRWGLNVKAKYIMSQRSIEVQTAAENLPDHLLSGLEELTKEFFWREIEHLAISHGFSGQISQEGRSGGWACLADTQDFESGAPNDPTDEEGQVIARWLDFCFEADELRETAEVHFDDRILEANQNLQVELSEYADWVGAEIRTLDGDTFKAARLEIRNGRAALMPEKPAQYFSLANEATLIRKADGQVPSRLTADPIMEQVFQIIEGRANLTREQINDWLDADDDNDPLALYEDHVAPAVNAIEDLMLAQEADDD